MKFVRDRTENIVGKGENAGYQHLLLFPQSFQNASHSASLNLWIFGMKTYEDVNVLKVKIYFW